MSHPRPCATSAGRSPSEANPFPAGRQTVIWGGQALGALDHSTHGLADRITIMKSILEYSIVAIGISLHLAAAGEAAAEGWQAGTARAAITPRDSMWMAGYGSRNRPSEGAVHDLWAKAL